MDTAILDKQRKISEKNIWPTFSPLLSIWTGCIVWVSIILESMGKLLATRIVSYFCRGWYNFSIKRKQFNNKILALFISFYAITWVIFSFLYWSVAKFRGDIDFWSARQLFVDKYNDMANNQRIWYRDDVATFGTAFAQTRLRQEHTFADATRLSSSNVINNFSKSLQFFY